MKKDLKFSKLISNFSQYSQKIVEVILAIESDIHDRFDFREHIYSLIMGIEFDNSSSVAESVAFKKLSDFLLSHLLKTSKSQNDGVRAKSIFLMGKLGNPDANNLLLELLQHDEEQYYSSNRNSMFFIADEDMRDGAISPWEYSLRSYCAKAIIHINDVTILPDVLKLLSSVNSEVRTHAAEIIGAIGNPDCIPKLEYANEKENRNIFDIEQVKHGVKDAIQKLCTKYQLKTVGYSLELDNFEYGDELIECSSEDDELCC